MWSQKHTKVSFVLLAAALNTFKIKFTNTKVTLASITTMFTKDFFFLICSSNFLFLKMFIVRNAINQNRISQNVRNRLFENKNVRQHRFQIILITELAYTVLDEIELIWKFSVKTKATSRCLAILNIVFANI